MNKFIFNPFRLLVLFGLALVPNLIFGQASTDIKFSVSYKVTDSADNERLQYAKKQLTKAFVAKGGTYNEKEGFLFFIDLTEPDANNNIALSISTFLKVPEEVVKAGVKEEVFHKAVASDSPKPASDDGREIRAYINEEYMRQFTMIQDSHLEIINRDQLPEAIQRFVDGFKPL
ncbi:hypothetical protein [Gracilimonas sediminicola]|uniref:DUF4136 domain-containing protein n=1 Tax=Gracilimonas sediminicola TaxID=2952158 RepID=A0A9X2RDW9_9BACT|nr:hypothetical protein [Gracilimonas sediminicola]MCP9291505.1 hypothetical protein [Gracilimonas sediminicola]